MKHKLSKIYSYSVFYEAVPEGGYIAFVPALPGCHTQGETLEGAEKNVKEAIELYLESLAAHNKACVLICHGSVRWGGLGRAF